SVFGLKRAKAIFLKEGWVGNRQIQTTPILWGYAPVLFTCFSRIYVGWSSISKSAYFSSAGSLLFFLLKSDKTPRRRYCIKRYCINKNIASGKVGTQHATSAPTVRQPKGRITRRTS